MFASALYRTSPSWFQELLISARSWARAALRERGRAFRSLRDEALASQWYSTAKLKAFQTERLAAMLDVAGRKVPYYRKLFAEVGFDPTAFRELSQLSELPFLDKERVRADGDALIAESARKPLFRCYTSGATGVPLSMVQDLRAVRRENAFIWRQLQWAGFEDGDRRAWIRGDMIVPIGQAAAPYWRFDRNENVLMFSSYHLSQSSAREYLDTLRRFDPHLIQAYPSSIAFLASYLEENRRRYRGKALKAVVTSSETLSREQRGAIERAFGCRVFDWYGNGERVAAIGTCEEGRYHAMSDYSYLELVPAGDGLHEIVGTGFNNLVMPFIRYRTGDHVRLAPETASCPCGRALPLIAEIQGRKDDVVKLADGRHIGRLHHIFNGVSGILTGQIVQNTLDKIEIQVVPSRQFRDTTRKSLLSNARERLGHAVEIELVIVDAGIRTRAGKLRNVICNV